MGTPADLTLRRHLPSDLREFVRIFNAAAAADGIDERVSEAGISNWFAHPSPAFDASRDVVVAEVDGEVVAYGVSGWVDTTDGLREHHSRGHVHPEWRRRGIGSAILAHNIARAHQVAAEQGDERTRVVGTWAADRQPGAIALLERNWFAPARWFFEMVRPTLDDINLPPGRTVGDIKTAIREAILDGIISNDYDAAHAFMLIKAKKLGVM